MLLLLLAGLGHGGPAAAESAAAGPDILPPLPQGGIGLPSPLVPPNALPGAMLPGGTLPPPPPPPAPPPGAIPLPPVAAGTAPLQLYNPNAPSVLIRPYASFGERFTDNVEHTTSDRTAAAETRLISGLSVSADTPRLQGVLRGDVEGDLYTPTGNLDQVLGNLYASGLGTIVPDRLFVDARSSITQGSTVPGLGFTSPSLLPRTQQTQLYVNTVSPYLRQSFDDLVDTELRYRFGATDFGGNTQTFATPGSLASNNLVSGILNEGTFIAATGADIERAPSRLTVDVSSFSSNSIARNTQFSAYDDFEYRLRPQLALLARLGYQNIRYPFVPGASFAGATWLVGGRIGVAAETAYLRLEYGVQQGVYGFTGSALYRITPTMVLSASLVQGVSAPSEYLLNGLSTSTLNPYGAIVDQNSGLPTAFYNPGLGLTNAVYRQRVFNVGLSDEVGTNRYSAYGYYISQVPLGVPAASPTRSLGINGSWARSMRPDLNGVVSVGYFSTHNALAANAAAPIGNLDTVTANLGLNYLFAPTLTGSILYTFSYQTNGGAAVLGAAGTVVVNSLQFLLTKTF